MKYDKRLIGITLLRLTIGLMFVIVGYKKVSDIGAVVGMLTGLEFPTPIFFAWLLALSELLFGLSIFVGFKTKYTSLPLALILLIAEIVVVIPSSGGWSTNSFFHLISIAGLITIALSGPGVFSITRN